MQQRPRHVEPTVHVRGTVGLKTRKERVAKYFHVIIFKQKVAWKNFLHQIRKQECSFYIEAP